MVLFLFFIAEGSRTHNGLKRHFCPSLRYLHREIRPVCPCASALIWTKIAILNFYEPKGTDFVIENGSRSEGIPGVFQATRVVLCAKAVLLGVMGSIPFGYTITHIYELASNGVSAALLWFVVFVRRPALLHPPHLKSSTDTHILGRRILKL